MCSVGYQIIMFFCFLCLPNISFCTQQSMMRQTSHNALSGEFQHLSQKEAKRQIKEIEQDIIRLGKIYNRKKYNFEYYQKTKKINPDKILKKSKFQKNVASYKARIGLIENMVNQMIAKAGQLDKFLQQKQSFTHSVEDQVTCKLLIKNFKFTA